MTDLRAASERAANKFRDKHPELDRADEIELFDDILAELEPTKPAEPEADKSLGKLVGDVFSPGKWHIAFDSWKECCNKSAAAVEAEVLRRAGVEQLREENARLQRVVEANACDMQKMSDHLDSLESELAEEKRQGVLREDELRRACELNDKLKLAAPATQYRRCRMDETVPPTHGDHGGPLCSFTAHYEDGSSIGFGHEVIASQKSAAVPTSDVIKLNPAEIQSGLDRVRWAEGLIEKMSRCHEGRNSWLMNYGINSEAIGLRKERSIEWDAITRSAKTVSVADQKPASVSDNAASVAQVSDNLNFCCPQCGADHFWSNPIDGNSLDRIYKCRGHEPILVFSETYKEHFREPCGWEGPKEQCFVDAASPRLAMQVVEMAKEIVSEQAPCMDIDGNVLEVGDEVRVVFGNGVPIGTLCKVIEVIGKCAMTDAEQQRSPFVGYVFRKVASPEKTLVPWTKETA